MTEIRDIPLSKIHASRLQMRHWMNPEKLERHIKSMQDQGQERPIKVRPHPDIEGDFEVAYGHRTLAALLKAGKATVQAIVEELTDEQVMLAQRAENREKEDVSDYDMAIWYKTMIEKFGYTQEKLAEIDGVSQSVVANHLRMLKIEDSISREIIYRITERQVRAILEAPPELLSNVCREIEQFDRENGFIPSASTIADIIELVSLNYPKEEVKTLPEEEQEREEEDRGGIRETLFPEPRRTVVQEPTAKPTGIPTAISMPVEAQRSLEKSEPSISVSEKYPAARDYIVDYFSKNLKPDEAFLAWSVSRKFGISEMEAKDLIHEYKAEPRRRIVEPPKPEEKEIDQAVFTCKTCGQSFLIVHLEPSGNHKLRPVREDQP